MKIHYLVIITFLVSCEFNIPQKDAFLEIDGNLIHYKVEGKGDPIYLLHGGYLSLDIWDIQVSQLKENFKIVRFSDLGHGKTINSGNPVYGREIIENLRAKEKDDKITLMGLSWGAMMAVDYAVKYPDYVEKLILVSPGLNGWNYFQDTIAAKNNQLRAEATESGNIPLASSLFHKNWVVGPRRDINVLDSFFAINSLRMIENTMTDHWQESWSIVSDESNKLSLGSILVPTYLIYGNQDALDIKLIVKEYDKQIPATKTIEMSGLAHLPNLESPAEFNRIISSILQE